MNVQANDENELNAFGIKARGYKSDAANHKASEDLVNAVVSEFGTLDILVNNAGITRDTLLMRMSEAQWDEVINANLKSVFQRAGGLRSLHARRC